MGQADFNAGCIGAFGFFFKAVADFFIYCVEAVVEQVVEAFDKLRLDPGYDIR
jgi:hypothetical protein